VSRVTTSGKVRRRPGSTAWLMGPPETVMTAGRHGCRILQAEGGAGEAQSVFRQGNSGRSRRGRCRWPQEGNDDAGNCAVGEAGSSG